MNQSNSYEINQLEQLQQVAKLFKTQLKVGDTVYLEGDLGAGKTTFTQMLLQFCGVDGHVKSPTYNLFETYESADSNYVHMDLYRLTDPEELYFLGIEDLADGKNILLIEWPDKGRGVLPKADWRLCFSMENLNRTLIITSEK